MDVRLAILAGTFLLLIASIVGFIVTLVRAAREPRLPPAATPYPWPALPPAPGVQVDTSLEGLHVEVGEEALSASLLTPLRTGEWVPDAVPATAAELPDISLEKRIESFEPIPDIREPAFSADSVDEWKRETPSHPPVAENTEVVAEPVPDFEAPAPAPPAAVVSPVVTQRIVATPVEPVAEEVTAVESASEAPFMIPEVRVEPTGEEAEREFDAEIAALLSVVGPEPLAPEPAVTPVSVPAPESVVAVESAVAPQFIAVPESIAVMESVPALESAVVPEPAVAVAAATGVGADENELWQTMLREEQGLPSVVTSQAPLVAVETVVALEPAITQPPVVESPAPGVPRPAAVVHEPPAPSPASAPAAPAVRRKPRPAVRVAGSVVAPVEPDVPAPVTIGARDERAGVPEIHMAAPVEMWFGEHRVGVKAGTSTYDRFRKYADVLLGDLRSSRGAGV